MFAQSSSAKGSGKSCGHELCAPRPLAHIAVRVFIRVQEAVLLARNTGDGGAVLADDTVFALGKVLETDWASLASRRSGSHVWYSALLEAVRSIFFERGEALRGAR